MPANKYADRPARSYDPDEYVSFFETKAFVKLTEAVLKVVEDGDSYRDVRLKMPPEDEAYILDALEALTTQGKLTTTSILPTRWKHATEARREPKRYSYSSSLGKIGSYDPTKPTVSMNTNRRSR